MTLGGLLRGFWAAPILAGVLLWASFPPLDVGLLAPVGFAVLFLSMRLRAGSRSGYQALVAGMIWFLGGLTWMWPLVAPGWVFVAFWCAAYEALCARCLRPSLRAARDGASWRWVVTAPLLHVGFDMLRTVVFTGFPWLLPGYSAWRNPVLLGSADLLGVHGATLAIVALGAALAEVAARAIEGRTPRWTPLVPAAVLWGAFAAWAAVRPVPSERPGPTVLVLQASIPQYLSGEGRPTREEWWAFHERLAEEGFAEAERAGRKVDVVLWPETMVPALVAAPIAPGAPFLALEEDVDGGVRLGTTASRRVAAASRGAWTYAGFISETSDGRQRNTVVVLDGNGRVVGVQDKQHLTPAGETLLFMGLLPDGARKDFEAYLSRSVGFLRELTPGEGQSILPLRGSDGAPSAGILICYESLFPELCRGMAGGGADVLVNLSNYGWFHHTPQMDQALAIATFRAAELRRPLVLASSNGISAVIGADGSVRSRTDSDVRTFLLADVPLSSGSTVFSILGEWSAWALGLTGALLAWAARRSAHATQARETS